MRDYQYSPELSHARAEAPAEGGLRAIVRSLDATAPGAGSPSFRGIGAADAQISANVEPLGGAAKRATDIVLASLVLILLAPLMLTVSALVRIFLGGPVVVSQERIGFAGRTFNCYRFRATAAVADDGSGCLGRVLRESSIDELPQLFNVLRGDMSLAAALNFDRRA